MEKGMTPCDRRSFLKGLLACGGTASLGALVGCSPNQVSTQGVESGEEIAWDEEFDVVVVGSGTALVSALAASDKGAKTLVVEKASSVGGTTVFGCAFWLPNNPLEKPAGIDDSHDQGLEYIKACAEAWGGQWREEVIESYLTNGLSMMDMMSGSYGFEFTLDVPATADYFGLSGALTKGRSVGINLDEGFVEFKDVWPIVAQCCEGNGVEIRTSTEAQRLITDGNGNVVGIAVKGGSGVKNIKATKGVVIGSGGFDHNEEMVDAYLRTPLYSSLAVPTNTGDGQLMAMEAGASMANMQCSWGAPYLLVDPEKEQYSVDFSSVRNKPGSIIVNRRGERFADEASAYAVFNRAFDDYDTARFEYRNIPAYLICDSKFAEKYPMAGFKSKAGDIPVGATKAETLDELAETLGIDAAGLNETIAAFNAAVPGGVDSEWLRGASSPFAMNGGDKERDDLANRSMDTIDAGPYYGIPMFPGAIGTCGGIAINGNAQALDKDGAVIEGLYAVGNAAGSIFGGAYTGPGATIGSGMIMGYAAGCHVAAK